ncbi:hypothetical protein FYK55_23460 [Roseiconus nitratireducens]|uniref:Uncharacterized protein n=1 Tax=Roseiconus nitratireducens TaxID=2605748 RepID=A0A5M6CX05_9BACT|nr:hypothetical protein [Roseiconus nitratireducens]KAA5539758.1 hypothetical protein FYK55_23460 [Roseiconus nitratireducens]
MNLEKLNLDNLDLNKSLPEILQAEWSKDQVLQLFDDLRDGAIVEHVQLRSSNTDGAVKLAGAKRAFFAGEAHAIQIRYVFENETWCDTIMPGDPTTKIIRNRIPTGDSPD